MSQTDKIADRLVQMRLALGYGTQADLCRAIDIEPNRWNQYETGERRITLEVVGRLKRRFGIRADWIYFGDLTGMPRDIADKLFQDAAE